MGHRARIDVARAARGAMCSPFLVMWCGVVWDVFEYLERTRKRGEQTATVCVAHKICARPLAAGANLSYNSDTDPQFDQSQLKSGKLCFKSGRFAGKGGVIRGLHAKNSLLRTAVIFSVPIGRP